MLADLTTYRPEDFLLFGPEVYWRLFALQNAALWPLHVATTAFGLFLCAVASVPEGQGKPPAGHWLVRGAATGLALLWLLVGWTFLLDRYSPVNWAIDYAVPLFALEAALLLACAVPAGSLQPAAGWTARRIAGLGLLGYAVLLHPLTGLLAGRPWNEAEVFGLAPDPTAMATLGILLAAADRASAGRWLVLIGMAVPLAWCLVSAATLLTLGGWAGWLPLAAALLAVAALAAGGHRGRAGG
ncbi:DUF6064 family protein [Marinibaculum pumilum]|uniref:DUF6064 family protein n=1 Tax=Marinibaculum pumilum TaxID=1766165 RepID=A0ABV7KYT3_9PROT